MIDATEVKINRPKKNLANDSGKKKFHAMKAQAIVTNIFAKVKTFKMISTIYRNHHKRFGLRMNLSAGIINHELGF
ncbi:mobile genetic element [Streptococcus pneumoniae]|nr:mobile genetic element [Streptococcus pneumoniae]